MDEDRYVSIVTGRHTSDVVRTMAIRIAQRARLGKSTIFYRAVLCSYVKVSAIDPGLRAEIERWLRSF